MESTELHRSLYLAGKQLGGGKEMEVPSENAKRAILSKLFEFDNCASSVCV